MRIISGSHKGRRIVTPKKLPVRPTTDKLKETLFNILSNRIEWDTINALDLFSGTGSIGYEFCSRGVKQVTSVDKNKNCTKFIVQTSQNFGFDINVVCRDVLTYLEKQHNTFDIIFADPPYDIPHSDIEKLINLVFERNWLKKDGELIVEHTKMYKFDDHVNFQSSRVYGSSVFSFFIKAGHKPDSV